MQEDYSYKFKVLQEKVASVDKLKDGTHSKLAETIHSIICNEDKAFTIGLKGSWGSGKSTVIKLLEDKFNLDNDKNLIFLFDAWAHDSDPLRRIFLEELIKKMDPYEQDAKLIDIREKITLRKKKVSVKTETKTTPLGFKLAFSSLFVPFGASLLASKFFDFWVWKAFGALLALAPILLLSFYFVCVTKIKNKKFKWDVIESKGSENYTQDVTEDGERTSVEFEKYFNEILGVAYNKYGSYRYSKVLIIIDNLDRVSSDCAKGLWATLQTFFQHRSLSENSSLSKNTWFVVPYDYSGISRIWVGEGVVESYLEKNFQLIFEVPKSVMTGWEEYFRSCVDTSLVGWPLDHKKRLIDTYKLCEGSLSSSPTPRNIHSFINQVGVLAFQWKNEFSPESLGYYVKLRKTKDEESLRTILISGDLYDHIARGDFTGDIIKELASLLFSVPNARGMELLLESRISELMWDDFNVNEIRELIDIHGYAFWETWMSKSDSWTLSEKEQINSAQVYLINLSEGFSGFHDEIRKEAVSAKEVWWSLSVKHGVEEYDSVRCVQAYLGLLNSNDKDEIFKNIFIEKVNEILKDVENPEVFKLNESGVVNIKILDDIFDVFLKNNYKIEWKRCEELNKEGWIFLQDKMNSTGTKLINFGPASGVEKELFEDSFDGVVFYSESFEYLADIYERTYFSSDWSGIFTQLSDWLSNDNRPNDCGQVYDFLLNAIGRFESPEVILDIVRRDEFWVCFSDEDVELDNSLAILTGLAFSNEIFPSYVPNVYLKFWEGNESDSVVEDCYEYFKRMNDFEGIWDLAANIKGGIANKAIRIVKDENLFSVKAGAYRIDEVDVEKQYMQEIVTKLSEFGSFEKIKNDIEKDPSDFQNVVEIFFEYGRTADKVYIRKFIKNIEVDEWKDLISNGSPLISIMERPSKNYTQAITRVFEEYIVGEGDLNFVNVWENLSVILSKVLDLKDFKVKLSSLYFSNQGDRLEKSEFESFTQLIVGDLTSVPDTDLQDKILFWIEYENFDRVEWLCDTVDRVLIKPKELFIETIVHEYERTVGVDVSLMDKLCDSFGIKSKVNIRLDENRTSENEETEVEEIIEPELDEDPDSDE